MELKPGSVNQGPCTTPDLFGTDEQYVAITDNSLIGCGDSLVVGNDYGCENPHLPAANGLLCSYEREPDVLGIGARYPTAVDFRTGERRWRKLTGTGPACDDNWAPITIGPERTAYVGVFNGIVAVRDTR